MRTQDALKKLYNYTCDIYEFETFKDDESKKTYNEIVLTYQKIPCKISYHSKPYVNHSKENYFYNEKNQYIKLFLQNDITIKAGSFVEIFRDGKKIQEFKNSGEPYIYTSHQEVLFELSQSIS